MFDLIGSSPAFRASPYNLALVAPVNTAVLIQGETGTGKEVIARAIPEASPRHNQRFVALNCAAIPSALFENELFGHEKGAFTRAVAQTIGRFQAADRGTLFLDEIGDFPRERQPKLLRVLQEKQFERLGSALAHPADVRVIAATNQHLSQMVQDRTFRTDPFYRLNVFPMPLPPLRERRSDIPLQARHFVRNFAKQQSKKIDTILGDVMAALVQHGWPGNIRQLQSVIESGVIMTTGSILTRQTTAQIRVVPAVRLASIKTFAEAERAHIIATLHETNWVIGGPRGAASRLGLPGTILMSRMQRLGTSGGVPRGRPGRLVTGQNPASSTAGTKALLDVLSAKKAA